MVAKYRSVLSIPGCARVFTTALIGRLPQGMSSLAILAGDSEAREAAYALESVIQELIWISGPLVVAFVVAFASPSAAVLLSGACCILGTTLFVRSPVAARYRVLTVATVISTAPLIAARTIPEGVVAALRAGVTIAPAFSFLYALVGRIVSPGVETEAFTWAASSLIVGLAIGSALGGAAIDAAGVSGPFVLSCLAAGQSIGRTGRQGLPKHRWRAGMSRVTTLPAPITQPVPIVTPGHTITAVASHASSSIVIGAPHSRPVRRSPASRGWEGVTSCTPGPICTSSPIDTGPESRITAPKLTNVRAPTEIW
jgi:hypothetical protein